MWLWAQKTGELYSDLGAKLIGTGYSGFGEGKNNPQLERDPDVGPIPVGFYTFCPPEDSPTHGPFVLPLLPDENNEMFGRSGFLCHGDSIEHPGQASKGCIILARTIRELIWNSEDHRLCVVEEFTAGDDNILETGAEGSD